MVRVLALVKKYWIAAASAAVYVGASNLLFGKMCPMRIVLGLPCPACGFTRAGFLLLRGHLHESIAMHPLFIPVAISAGCMFLLRQKKRHLYHKLLLPCVALFGIVMVALYLYRMAFCFGVPPMVRETPIFPIFR